MANILTTLKDRYKASAQRPAAQAVVYAEGPLGGLDARNARLISSPNLQRADNVLFDPSADGLGALMTRPGFQAQLTTSHTGSGTLHWPLQFIKSDGTSVVVYVAAGKMWAHVKGSGVDYEVVYASGGASMDVNGETVELVRSGKFAYIVDGVAGRSIKRVNLDVALDTAPNPDNYPAGYTIPTLTKPSSTKFTVGLTNSSLLSDPGSLTWAQDAFTGWAGTGQNIVTAAQADPATGVWTLGGSASFITVNGRNAAWVDQAADTALSPALVNVARATATTDYQNVFKLTYEANGGTNNPTQRSPHDILVTAYSDTGGTSAISGATRRFTIEGGGGTLSVSKVLDFRDVATEIKSLKVQAIQVIDAHFYGTAVYGFAIQAPENKLSLANAAGELQVSPGTYLVEGGTAYVSGAAWEYTYASTQDWSGKSKLVFRATVPSNLAGSLRLQVSLRGTSGAAEYTRDVIFNATTGEAYVDVSTISDTIRAAVKYFGFRIVSDVPTASSTDPIVTIGNILDAGNLSEGTTYYYRIVEVDDQYAATDLYDLVKSDGSDPAVTQLVTASQAMANAKMPARTNAGAARFMVFRGGGSFDDGQLRLLAMLRFDTNVAMGADTADGDGTYPAVRANPYVSFTKAAGGTGVVGATFVDNTPDEWLLDPTIEVYQYGREAPPVGCSCVAYHNNRLWVTKGQDLYASWELTTENPTPVYFTRLTLPSSRDPETDRKGWLQTVGGADNDPIQRIVPYNDLLVIFKQKGIWILDGNAPSNYSLRRFRPMDDSLGLIAKRCCEVYDGAVWYLSPSGLMRFDAGGCAAISEQIDPVLFPQTVGGSAITASLMAAAAMAVHSRRLWLFAPTSSSDTTNTAAYVFDFRVGRWTRQIQMPEGITGGTSLSAKTDTDDFYMGGSGGQLFRLTGNADKTVWNGSATAITAVLKSRAYGMETPAIKKPVRLAYRVTTGESAVITATVTGDVSGAAQSWTYQVNGDAFVKPFALRTDARGSLVTVQLSVPSSASATKFYGWELYCAAGAPRG